jgi:hypothetical protein
VDGRIRLLRRAALERRARRRGQVGERADAHGSQERRAVGRTFFSMDRRDGNAEDVP